MFPGFFYVNAPCSPGFGAVRPLFLVHHAHAAQLVELGEQRLGENLAIGPHHYGSDVPIDDQRTALSFDVFLLKTNPFGGILFDT